MTAGSMCLYRFVTGFTLRKWRTPFFKVFLKFMKLKVLLAAKCPMCRNLYSCRFQLLNMVHYCRFRVLVAVCHWFRTQFTENFIICCFFAVYSIGRNAGSQVYHIPKSAQLPVAVIG